VATQEPVWRHFQTVFGLFHGSNGLYLLKLISISLEWTHSGHVMCSWTGLDTSFIPNTPKTAKKNWPSPHRKHGHFQTVFCFFHGSNGLHLLKLISISLEWTHSGHLMCSLSELDPHCLTSSPHYSAKILQWPHKSQPGAIFRQFLASFMDPMDCIC
jgi:hypothetical protein